MNQLLRNGFGVGSADVDVNDAPATTTVPGSMSAADKVKLNTLSVTSTVYPVLGSDPASPAAGFVVVYAKAGGIYQKDSSGVVTQLAFVP